ncbi:hypothetical protein F7725_028119 [Dissostichus mawsoni]|uniref:Uncharacterized protein n=1 Tax=Dissostichus mawsoni TaxID=36200 RepID=A0A7J5XF42_DISMA|nr:hypothetical protein F7725_028119 [Dissostichus mawsoni]
MASVPLSYAWLHLDGSLEVICNKCFVSTDRHQGIGFFSVGLRVELLLGWRWLKCCGFNNYTDFVGSKFEEENGGSLPPLAVGLTASPAAASRQSAAMWRVTEMLCKERKGKLEGGQILMPL